MSCLSQARLVLFFTRGVSLRIWDQVGMLQREVEIYRRLRPHLAGISFLTYGDAGELSYASKLDGIQILYNRWKLPKPLFVRLAPVIYGRQLQQAGILKTNQVNGSEAALLAKRLYGKPLVARCGYMWSVFAQRRADGRQSREVNRAIRRERAAFSGADQVVVTTEAMKQYAVQRYGLLPEKVRIIPNYVLTDVFAPLPNKSQVGRRILFIGRLDPQKNPQALLKAIHGLDVELVMIGGGPLRGPLEEKAQQEGLDVTFLGNRPHHELPQYLNQANLFVLPSLYEGHPKTLMEAMACGLPVIGTDVPGIRELIQHRQTGFLCGTSPAEIRAAIQEVLGDADLRARMGSNAREFVVENFSVDRILELELELLQSLVTRDGENA